MLQMFETRQKYDTRHLPRRDLNTTCWLEGDQRTSNFNVFSRAIILACNCSKFHDLTLFLEKGMMTHWSILAQRIPWTEEPGRLQSMGLQRVGHDWDTTTDWLLSFTTQVLSLSTTWCSDVHQVACCLVYNIFSVTIHNCLCDSDFYFPHFIDEEAGTEMPLYRNVLCAKSQKSLPSRLYDISYQMSSSEIVVHGILEKVVSRPSQDSTSLEEHLFWTKTWFQIGKGVHQGCVLAPWLFNLDAVYIMRNAGLEETQTGIKIAGRNINNVRYVDDTTLMAERN